MKCKECGEKINHGERYCDFCGLPVYEKDSIDQKVENKKENPNTFMLFGIDRERKKILISKKVLWFVFGFFMIISVLILLQYLTALPHLASLFTSAAVWALIVKLIIKVARNRQ